jgi:DNA-binding response OmpR family regulator
LIVFAIKQEGAVMGGAMQSMNTAPALERLHGLRVIIVDDDRDSRQALGVLFDQAGLQVSLAESAPVAERLFRNAQPDVIIIDLAMPGQDGFALIRRLRALERDSSRHSVAVAITAFRDPEIRRRASDEGFDDYFVKPVSLVALIARLVQLCGRGKRTGDSTAGDSVPPRSFDPFAR